MNMNELSVVNKPLVCPTIVGRAIELATLRSIVEEVEGGHSRVVLLSGEAGIGKSRLVAEAKSYSAAQGFLLLQGQCFPTDRSCPYAPLLELVRSHLATSSREHMAMEMGSLASVLSPLLPDLLPLLSDLPPLAPLAPEQEKRRFFAALAHLFWRTCIGVTKPAWTFCIIWRDAVRHSRCSCC
jgi:predicted ATPase